MKKSFILGILLVITSIAAAQYSEQDRQLKAQRETAKISQEIKRLQEKKSQISILEAKQASREKTLAFLLSDSNGVKAAYKVQNDIDNLIEDIATIKAAEGDIDVKLINLQKRLNDLQAKEARIIDKAIDNPEPAELSQRKAMKMARANSQKHQVNLLNIEESMYDKEVITNRKAAGTTATPGAEARKELNASNASLLDVYFNNSKGLSLIDTTFLVNQYLGKYINVSKKTECTFTITGPLSLPPENRITKTVHLKAGETVYFYLFPGSYTSTMEYYVGNRLKKDCRQLNVRTVVSYMSGENLYFYNYGKGM